MSARYEVKPEGKGKDKQFAIWDNHQGKAVYRTSNENNAVTLCDQMNVRAGG